MDKAGDCGGLLNLGKCVGFETPEVGKRGVELGYGRHSVTLVRFMVVMR